MNSLKSMNVTATISDCSYRMSSNRDSYFRIIDQLKRMIDDGYQRVRDAPKNQKHIERFSHALCYLFSIVQQRMILAYLLVNLSSITSDLIRTVISPVSTLITTMTTRNTHKAQLWFSSFSSSFKSIPSFVTTAIEYLSKLLASL